MQENDCKKYYEDREAIRNSVEYFLGPLWEDIGRGALIIFALSFSLQVAQGLGLVPIFEPYTESVLATTTEEKRILRSGDLPDGNTPVSFLSSDEVERVGLGTRGKPMWVTRKESVDPLRPAEFIFFQESNHPGGWVEVHKGKRVGF